MDRKQKKNMIVSIIIPTYRRVETFKRALKSAIEQSYEQVEIIVVDDNADEKWNLEIEKIIFKIDKEKKIRYIRNQTNEGSAETRNIGIGKANGTYITFLDDDDIYLKDKVKNQLNYMLEYNADFSLTDLILLSEKGKVIEIRKRKYLDNANREDLLKYHFKYHMTGTDVMMFKKEYLIKIGGFEPIDVGDEFYLMKKAIDNRGSFCYVPNCDVKAYVHTETEGLSSGESKILGENILYEYKKEFFHYFSKKDVKYMKVRHYAVLAFAEVRRKNIKKFIIYSIKSFFHSPIQFANIVIERHK